MKKFLTFISIILCFCMITPAAAQHNGNRPQGAASYTASGYTTYTMSDCKLEWTVPNTTEGGKTCTALQGMNVGTNYAYVAKRDSTDTYCDITRVNLNTGEKVVMDYYASESATSSSACNVMGHANDICLATINGEHFLYVATIQSPNALARLRIDGTRLIFTGFFDLTNSGGDSIDASAVKLIKIADGYQYFLIKRKKKFYACRIPTDATGGSLSNPTKIKIYKIFTIDTSNAVFATSSSAYGTVADIDGWVNQGFGYNKNEGVIYVPIYDDANPSCSAIITYNIKDSIDSWIASSSNSSRIVYPTKTAFWLENSSLSQFELETCGFRTSQGADGDNKLYIAVNCYPSDTEGIYSCTYTSGTGDFTPLNSGTTTYTVSYNANGGTGTTEDSNHIYGIKTKLRTNAFTREGYSFAGWYLTRKSDGKWLYFTADGSAKWYTKGAQPRSAILALYGDRRNISALSSADGDTVTCYAQWTPDSTGTKSFYIRYDANGGTGSMEDTKIVYGSSTATRANSFKREGYTFVGWNAYRHSQAQWAYKTTDNSAGAWLTTDSDTTGYILRTYGNGCTLSNTSSVDADIITFYAAWARITDSVTPTKIAKGTDFTLAGTLVSDTDMYGATVSVRDSAGTAVGSYSASPCSDTFNIADANSAIDFSKLAEGSYTLEVTLQAVNGSPFTVLIHSSVFEVIIPSLTLIENSDYALGEELTKVALSTSAEAVIAQFVNEDVRILDLSGNSIVANAKVGTGFTVACYSGDTLTDSKTVIVKGDTNGDGSLSSSDYLNVISYKQGVSPLAEAFCKAADITDNGIVDSSDYMMIVSKLKNTAEW